MPENMWISLLWIAAGAFPGAVVRYLFSKWVQSVFPSVFPADTFLINSTGAFLLGYLLGHSASDSLRLWIGTGFMGAFTTFSTLKMESVKLLDQKRSGIWLLYTGATYSVGLALAYAGFIL